MFLICLRIDGNEQVASSEWKRFTIPLKGNRLFRGRLRIKHMEVEGQRANDSLSLLSNVLELRAANSEQILRFMGRVVYDATSQQRSIVMNCEDINLFVSNLYTQADRFDMEYRTLSIRPISAISGTEIWYPTIMTSNSENIEYDDAPGSGTYSVSVTTNTDNAWRAFNKVLDDSWESEFRYVRVNSAPNNTNGEYTGSESTDGVLGEWIQVDFPCPLYITEFKVYVGDPMGMRDVVLFAYDTVGSLIGQVFSGTLPYEVSKWFSFKLDVPGIFASIRVVCTRTYNQRRCRVNELAFIGSYNVQEPDEMQLTFNVTM